MQTFIPLPQRAVPASLNVESTLTDRYQTNLPEAVPGALQLGKGDKIHYRIRPSSEVLLNRIAGHQVYDLAARSFWTSWLAMLAAIPSACRQWMRGWSNGFNR